MASKFKYSVIARKDGEQSYYSGGSTVAFPRLLDAKTYAASKNNQADGFHYYVRKEPRHD